MSTILKTKSIYFNDVNLIPQIGVVESRGKIPDENYRVIVSPMPSVVGHDFIAKAAESGISVAIPRSFSIEKQRDLEEIFLKEKIDHRQMCFYSIRLDEDGDKLEQLYDTTRSDRALLIDMANGYVPQLQNKVYEVLERLRVINTLMIGNVVTANGARYIKNKLRGLYGELIIRVGIGNGGPCSTSDVTGVNRGQITELLEICESDIPEDGLYIASDGGIHKGGHAAKAFGAGADFVMMGGYFSKAAEAETNVSGDGTYYGCASKKHIALEGIKRHSEGKINSVDINEIEPLKDLVYELFGGIKSAVSYCGYCSIADFIGNGVFEKKQNSLPPKKRF